ncbi:HsdM family class I SAM-dependent methyltransferase [Pseudomonas capsici]|uniref:site-specific DNA-methyltransferase (adenine-specific) n=1 Tax=Pseudomonas capsici TaxID=2810614 RepID=A0ABT3BX61_9PSED|nr:SAM-dependent methyltransferase [Pseudomonas capsici]MCV4267800.1 SAM-dependent methyltransferase [Pseudomonas capsici]MCV4276082.1 SAM-dependent methyltransferase [Pseudomonas capsici]MCV4278617.1 SAM-dependent methyltransferase [Pseudomonas capsici]MCV4331849.1 SAM-dependent methyltransferase [Pseudomonas capsici]MCV4377371.1 SAM-dependent methyltransferase [Pseudomonas capsici]
MLVEETLQLEEVCALAHEERRRSLGAFYTPSFLSKLLCVWAIQNNNQVVLEPSFGGCTFLEEIASRFKELGSGDPLKGVYGCDIDRNAFLKLETLDIGGHARNFIQKDFLLLSHESFCVGKADVVIGNPPYIGHSQIGAEQRKAIDAWKGMCGYSLDAKSSLWVYFLIHSLSFLKPGGRLAFVLPGSFLSADYSKKIHKILCEKFAQCLVVSLAERIFISEGAEERTVILFAEGYKDNASYEGVVKVAHVSVLSDLPDLIAGWERDASRFYDFSDVGIGSFLDRTATDKFIELDGKLSGTSLGDIAKVSIGIVTGDTKYFIKSLRDWHEIGVSETYLKFVVPKIRGISGVYLTKAQVKYLLGSDARCLLLNTEQESLSPEVVLYLSQYPEEKKSLATYKKRSIWHQPDDHRVPDGFFTFLTHNGPRLVLNDAKVNCTNSVHRLFFKKKKNGVEAKLVALSMLSTFTQVHAEIIGRPCGSGALKLEPKDALQLKLLMPNRIDSNLVKVAFRNANKALSKNPPDEEGARKIADEALQTMIDVDFQNDLEELGLALQVAREHRKGNVKLKLE